MSESPAPQSPPNPPRKRKRAASVIVRQREAADFPAVIELCQAVYPDVTPYTAEILHSQQRVFPEGQLVALDSETGLLLGTAMSLIVLWDDYDFDANWRDLTDGGSFTNHDPTGRTLYGAEVMVRPDTQGRGVGKAIYKARRDLCRRLALRRIRAGARLRGYHRHADAMSAETYVRHVIRGELGDATLSFQLRQGFRVIAVVEGYLRSDPDSLGAAAVIEWINHQVAQRSDYRKRAREFAKPRKPANPPSP
jgi:GNAT superfamily N-acetyltransferase